VSLSNDVSSSKRNEIIDRICDITGAKRGKVERDTTAFFWGTVFEDGGQGFKAYYEKSKPKKKGRILEVMRCIVASGEAERWAAKASIVSKLARKKAHFTKDLMNRTEVSRILDELVEADAIERGVWANGRSSYRLWIERDHLDPAHEMTIRRYTELEMAKLLLREYGERLGMCAGDVDLDLQRRLDKRLGNRRYATTFWPFFDQSTSDEDLGDFNAFYVDTEGDVSIEQVSLR
jgi:hypothetical protein